MHARLPALHAPSRTHTASSETTQGTQAEAQESLLLWSPRGDTRQPQLPLSYREGRDSSAPLTYHLLPEAQKQRGLQELGSTGATPPSAPPSLQGSSCTIMPQPLPLGDVPATESLPRCEQVPRTSAEADSGGFPR